MEEQTLQLDPQLDASAPVGAQAEPEVVDVSPDDRARQHYADVIGELIAEAIKSNTLPVLSNVTAFNLAWLIVEYGPVAAGHVLERLGSHISYFTERNRAAKEAEKAREAGRMPH